MIRNIPAHVSGLEEHSLNLAEHSSAVGECSAVLGEASQGLRNAPQGLRIVPQQSESSEKCLGNAPQWLMIFSLLQQIAVIADSFYLLYT